MRKNISIFLIILFGIIIEISFFPNFFSLQRVPGLVLIIVIFLSILDKSRNFWKWVFLAGLLFDIMTFQPLGLHSFSFLAVAYLTKFISERFLSSQNAWNFSIILAMIFLSSLLNDWLVIIFIKLEYFFREKKYIEGLALWDSGFFYRALYSSILGVIIHNPIKKILAAFSKKIITLK